MPEWAQYLFTHCRTGIEGIKFSTRCAAVSTIVRVLQKGQIPLPLQEKSDQKILMAIETMSAAKTMCQYATLYVLIEFFINLVLLLHLTLYSLLTYIGEIKFHGLKITTFVGSKSLTFVVTIARLCTIAVAAIYKS